MDPWKLEADRRERAANYKDEVRSIEREAVGDRNPETGVRPNLLSRLRAALRLRKRSR